MNTRWVFFVGAHGTITSTVVKTCEKENLLLQQMGTLTLLPKELKKIRDEEGVSTELSHIDAIRSLSRLISGINTQIEKSDLTERILLVEEGLLGSYRVNTKTGLLYPDLKRKLGGIPKILDNPWHTICFCIRPYHEIFEDCYYGAPNIRAKVDVVEFKRKVLKFDRTWINVLEDISERLPNIRIKIWRSDTTRKLKSEIEMILLDSAAGLFSNKFDPKRVSSSSEAHERPTIWTPHEVELSNAQFENDWHFIAAGWSDCVVE